MKCAFHAFDGEGLCPHCAEAAGQVAAPIGDDKWLAKIACSSCGVRDVRDNKAGGYSWCGACGARQHLNGKSEHE